FRNFTTDPLLQPILSDWYMTQNIQDTQEDTADIKFYKQISYTLLNDDGTFDTYMNLHSGDIVQIQEETRLSYAILKGIFTHRYNDGLVYSFIWVDWLRECSILDPILQCPVYEKQTAKNTRWH
ncbi:12155_t:CDS:2, partial [Dentiscutata heterogama]